MFEVIEGSVCAAVQDERQRGREKSDNEVESSSSFNEEMPVEKILDAELAVEPKTEAYMESSTGNSVSFLKNNVMSSNTVKYIYRI